MQADNELLSKVVNLSKRRGFIFPSSEIYGGLANTYDSGPLGMMLKENLKQLWWKRFVSGRDDNYGIDSSIIINPKVWEASGHVANFGDVMVEDTITHKRYRADHIIEDHFAAKNEEVKVDGKTATELQEIIEAEKIVSVDGNPFTKARKFNLLFTTEIGIIEGEGSRAYLRGEIAQGLFINYKNVLDSMRPKLPFGIAQAGKAFRNEVTKGQFTFRTLEFDLMEFEYFFDPAQQSWEDLFEYWRSEMTAFGEDIGLNADKLRWRKHEDFELSHYSKRTEDLEYKFPWGYKEMWGCAYRTDFDLRNHSQASGQDLNYTYPDGSKVTPHVIEPTFGLSRLVTVILMDAYNEEVLANGETRTVLKFNPRIAPYKLAILPLVKKDGLAELGQEIYTDLRSKFSVTYDQSGSVGKRYRKQDEIGTPFCATIDFQTLEDQTVTLRDRDTMTQERVKIADLAGILEERCC